MRADYVAYDEHALYPLGRRKAAGRFILRTHIENRTPYRTSDLIAIVHAVGAALRDRAFLIHSITFITGTEPQSKVSLQSMSGQHVTAWLPAIGASPSEVIEATLIAFTDRSEDLRERTRTLRTILKRTNKIELRRRRGKR